jgi:hypothetical protein
MKRIRGKKLPLTAAGGEGIELQQLASALGLPPTVLAAGGGCPLAAFFLSTLDLRPSDLHPRRPAPHTHPALADMNSLWSARAFNATAF